MTKETSKSVARLAARFLSGELKELTRKQQLSVCASCVSQAEAEQESVKAWGIIEGDGTLQGRAFDIGSDASYQCNTDDGAFVIPILITRLRPARADKRLTKRKR